MKVYIKELFCQQSQIITIQLLFEFYKNKSKYFKHIEDVQL